MEKIARERYDGDTVHYIVFRLDGVCCRYMYTYIIVCE